MGQGQQQTLAELIWAADDWEEPPTLLNHTQNILGLVISFMVITWICALLRIYTRAFIVHSLGWDDFFVVLSLLSTSAGSVSICLAATEGGLGQHFTTLSLPTMIKYCKLFYVANATYPGSAGCIKLALLFQYLRVYDRASAYRKATITTIVVVAVWALVYAILCWVPSIPVYAFWDLTIPAARYAFGSPYVEPFVASYTTVTASNMILDLIILGLAVPLLVHSSEEKDASRLALCCLFAIGSIASTFSVLRLASIIKTRAATYPRFDPTFYGSTPIVLAALEVDVAVICAALPVFWPVLCEMGLGQILVTREFKIDFEQRRLSARAGRMMQGARSSYRRGGREEDEDEEDGIELRRSESGLQQNQEQEQEQEQRQKNHYQDPFVAQQVSPFGKAEFGVKFAIEDSLPPSGRPSSDRGFGKRS